MIMYIVISLDGKLVSVVCMLRKGMVIIMKRTSNRSEQEEVLSFIQEKRTRFSLQISSGQMNYLPAGFSIMILDYQRRG